MAKPGKVLLFGGSGQLGSQILRLWSDLEVRAPARAETDIEDGPAVERALDRVAPDIVINCTAFNDVALAETQTRQAFELNALAVDRLAGACAARSRPLVTFSTDYVFDGELGRPYTETDEPHPLNVYGESKLAGERLVLARKSPAYVIRTCGVYGTGVSTSKGYTFVHRILDHAREGRPLRVVTDQTISPTYAADLATATRTLLESEAPFGLYHAVNQGAVTWYDFAREALRQAGIDRTVEAIASSDLPAGPKRPKFSALENSGLHRLGLEMPGWEDGLKSMLRDKAISR